jgi:hypothetical protein
LIIVPCLLIARKNIKLLLLSTLLTSLNFYVIIKTASVQGLVGTIIGVSFLIVIYLYFRNRLLFIGSAIVYLTGLIVGVLGMVNQGPLKGVSVGQFTLYKASVESRGDFWRSAIAMIQDNPLFGVGLDSFGDYFLTYRDEIAVKHEFSEFTDSAHNYYLEYAATGGIPLLLLHLIIILLSVWGIIKLIRNSIKFDRQITALVTIWLIYIAQSFISPGALGLIVIGSIVTGAIIGLSSSSEIVLNQPKMVSKSYTIKQWRMNIFLILISIVILLPYFNTDRLYLNALNSGDGVRLAESTKRFPEFTQRYSTASRLLLESKLYEKSLEVARFAIEFNPRNVSPWAHIFLNPISTPEEKQRAKEELIKLDPNNSALLDLKVGG